MNTLPDRPRGRSTKGIRSQTGLITSPPSPLPQRGTTKVDKSPTSHQYMMTTVRAFCKAYLRPNFLFLHREPSLRNYSSVT
jgi:hypothetical protein